MKQALADQASMFALGGLSLTTLEEGYMEQVKVHLKEQLPLTSRV